LGKYALVAIINENHIALPVNRGFLRSVDKERFRKL
jgi:hypothetical protein